MISLTKEGSKKIYTSKLPGRKGVALLSEEPSSPAEVIAWFKDEEKAQKFIDFFDVDGWVELKEIKD